MRPGLVRLGVEPRSPSVKEAFAASRGLMNAFLMALRSAGVAEKDQATVNFSVQFEQLYEREIRAGAAEGGTNQLRGVEFSPGDRAAAGDAERTAAEKAEVAKARTLAEAAGVVPGERTSGAKFSPG